MAAMQGTQDRIIRAAFMALSAYFLFAVMMVCAKLLSATHHIVELAFYRNFISLMIFVIWLGGMRQFDKIRMRKPRMTILRSVMGAFGLIFTFGAFANLPMADATVLMMSSVLITPALTFFLLKEPMGVHRWGAIGFGLLGVILMAGPSGSVNLFGTVCAFAAAGTHASMAVILRYLKDQSAVTTTFYFVLIGAIVPGVALPFVAQPFTGHEILLLLGCGIAGVSAQLLLSGAYRNGPAVVVAPFNYTGLIWGAMFDLLIWAAVPGWPVYAGAGVIMAANSYILYREHRVKKKEKAFEYSQ